MRRALPSLEKTVRETIRRSIGRLSHAEFVLVIIDKNLLDYTRHCICGQTFIFEIRDGIKFSTHTNFLYYICIFFFRYFDAAKIEISLLQFVMSEMRLDVFGAYV